MFSGIIEQLGEVVKIEKDKDNFHFYIKSEISKNTYIDQSIAHNGVCLTVVEKTDEWHKVTAIYETMKLTNLGELLTGDFVNLEICITADKLLDGHMVQGHVDTIGKVMDIREAGGSWYFQISYDNQYSNLIVSKGSVAVNGTSLTVVEPVDNTFKVAIIPYTYEHTNFHSLKIGDKVNLEFDIIGKYVAKQMVAYSTK